MSKIEFQCFAVSLCSQAQQAYCYNYRHASLLRQAMLLCMSMKRSAVPTSASVLCACEQGDLAKNEFQLSVKKVNFYFLLLALLTRTSAAISTVMDFSASSDFLTLVSEAVGSPNNGGFKTRKLSSSMIMNGKKVQTRDAQLRRRGRRDTNS